MAEFKSCFMGGYKKKAVDAYIEELENKNKELENNAKLNQQRLAKANKVYQEAKKLKADNEELKNEKEKLENAILNLQNELEQSQKQNSDHIANIGRIFYSAYESGSEITQKAKKGTNEFFEEIAKSSDNARYEVEKAINTYSLINTDVKALLESITKSLNAVCDNTDKLIEKANGVALSMKNIDKLKNENEENARNVIEKYDEFFKEYQNEKINQVKSGPKETVSKTPIVEESAYIRQFEEKAARAETEPEIKEAEKAIEKHHTERVQRVQRPVQNIQKPSANEPVRRAVDVIRQQMGTSKPAEKKPQEDTKDFDSKAPISQDRAVMLREVLKKFQNSENQE